MTCESIAMGESHNELRQVRQRIAGVTLALFSYGTMWIEGYAFIIYFFVSYLLQQRLFSASSMIPHRPLFVNRTIPFREGIAHAMQFHMNGVDWNELSSEYHEKLNILKEWNITDGIGLSSELQTNGYEFWYGEDIHVDVLNNTLIYHLQCLDGEYVYAEHPFDANARVRVTKKKLPPADVVYDRVGVVPYRNHYNLFHFLEGTNTIIRYYLDEQLNAPLSYLYLSHDDETHTFPGWFHDYLMDVLSGLPEEKRPIILERGMLMNLNKTIMFNRTVILNPSRPLVLFHSMDETRWIRRIIYKRFRILAEKESPHQITYVGRYCNSSRCNENDKAVMKGLLSVWKRSVFIYFDGMTYEQQVRIMADTDVVISIHGAQLTNILFMHPGCAVIEIFNPRFVASFYRDLSRACELDYYEFRGTRIAKEIPFSIRKNWWDANVNYHTLVNIDALLSVVQYYIQNW